MRGEAAQRWELRPQFGVGHLEHPLDAGQVGEPVLAQVEESHLSRKISTDELGGRMGAEHLAPGGSTQEGGDPVQCRPEVVPFAALRHPRVDRHPDPQRPGGGPGDGRQHPLGCHSGGDGVGGCLECRGHPISGVAEDLPACGFDAGAEQLVMPRQVDRHRFRIAFPPPGAGLDVAEEERGRLP
jgi:hypothetical protein